MNSTNDFKYRVAQVLSGDFPQRDKVPVCPTPQLLKDIGLSGEHIVLEQLKLRLCLAPKETSTDEERHHDLPIDFVDNLPQYINSPAMVLSSLSHPNDSVVLVTDCKDKDGDPIIIALKEEGKRGVVDGEVVTYNKLSSVYGKEDFAFFLKRSIEAKGANNGLLYYDEKKSRDLAVSAGLDLPRVLANHDPNVIIRRYNENVNTFKKKFGKNDKFFQPEQYGQKLYRKDGLPFAYTDPEGRQKQYEYTKTLDGDVVLRSTTVTFSDGRSETTDYSDRGKVVGISRADAHGRTTYSYSSDGMGYYASEKSIEYHDNDDNVARKSVHEKTREKIAERGYYHDTAKESWTETDERDNTTLRKYNVYGSNGKVQHATETKYSYDSYGNVVSRIEKDGCVNKIEYYPPSKVRDYFGYTIDDYDAGAIDHNKIKSETTRYPDGSIRIKSYTLDEKSTQTDYSPDGKITSFRDENGEVFHGPAAERALLRSSGQAPKKSETTAKKAPPKQAEKANATKQNKGKPCNCCGRRGGSSGAGR